MKALKVYVPFDEFSNYIKSKLNDEDLADCQDCVFVPIKIGLNECDFSVEALCVAAIDGSNT